MTTILVTGATGTLGKPTVAGLRAAGHEVRALSRKSAAGLVTGDLVTGAGIPEAIRGVETVLHLSTGKGDVRATETLLAAARAANVAHLLVISIVGIEGIPLAYYKDKVTIERLVAESSVPYTILRATQFHSFVVGIFAAQRFSPVVFAPSFSMQPIAVEEVAARLVELAGSDAAGRVADIGGPAQRTLRDLAHAWARDGHTQRPIWPLSIPGRMFAGFASGVGMVPGTPFGTETFEQYLAARRPTR
jgi:uncharacterized protein YbjT (DUF2867 family)